MLLQWKVDPTGGIPARTDEAHPDIRREGLVPTRRCQHRLLLSAFDIRHDPTLHWAGNPAPTELQLQLEPSGGIAM